MKANGVPAAAFWADTHALRGGEAIQTFSLLLYNEIRPAICQVTLKCVASAPQCESDPIKVVLALTQLATGRGHE